jgi:hypothetical protein
VHIINLLHFVFKIISDFSENKGLLFPAYRINIKSFTHKQTKMKKLLVVLAIGSFAACNGAASSTEAKVDSTATVAKDSVTAVADSAKAKIDSTAKAVTDTLKAKVDSVKK